jgi:hypothetical protein
MKGSMFFKPVRRNIIQYPQPFHVAMITILQRAWLLLAIKPCAGIPNTLRRLLITPLLGLSIISQRIVATVNEMVTGR